MIGDNYVKCEPIFALLAREYILQQNPSNISLHLHLNIGPTLPWEI